MRRLLFAGLLVAAACTVRAHDLGRPLLLIAAPDLHGLYSRTALLVVPTDGGQHLGFILNRVTGVHLATLFPDHAPSAKVVDPVYFGGPEMTGALFALMRRKDGEEAPGVPALHLFGDLYVTGNGAAVDRIIEQTPNDARYFVGFVGWRPGELARELERGFWYLAEPDAALAFSDPARMWEELVVRFERSGLRI